jgi:hypothetical protein
MKILKYSLIFLVAVSFASCLKSRSDVGGLITDKGSILTTIAEASYIHSDGQNIGLGYEYTNANFNFGTRPNESVKFFTVRVSQPKETKMSGPMVIKVVATPITATINHLGAVPTAIPAGAINVTDITIPQSSENLINVPVFYTVNKTLLNPAITDYGVHFKLTSTNQGAISSLDGEVDVILNYSDYSSNQNNSDYEANYSYTCVVTDPVNQFGITNVKPMYLVEDNATTISYADLYTYGFGASNVTVLYVNNYFTGARTPLFSPKFTKNASGKITGVSGIAGVALDPAAGPNDNQFVYTSNTVRTLTLRYIIPTTTTINGVSTPRVLSVKETFKYDPTQVYF